MTQRSGIVLSRAGGRYRVWCDGEVITASLRGRVKHAGHEGVLVGDQVELVLHPDGSATIEAIRPRRSLLRRREPGKRRGIRPVVANADQVVIVAAAREPAWDAETVDRFLAVAEASGLPALLVVNKCDLEPRTDLLVAPYHAAGYRTLETSVRTGLGLKALREVLQGKVSVFTGPTGVGKSSLLNALQPGLRLRTAPVSVKTGAGRHTTVMAEMHPFEAGGFVVDTPGLRQIGLWGLAPRDVIAAFPDIAAHGKDCRFDDCRHLGEPGCAVAAAVAEDRLFRSRFESYRRLLGEALGAARP
jgi:ribosome biogenesis GTPase